MPRTHEKQSGEKTCRVPQPSPRKAQEGPFSAFLAGLFRLRGALFCAAGSHDWRSPPPGVSRVCLRCVRRELLLSDGQWESF